MDHKKQATFPLRLSRSMRVLADELAHREGLSLNQFISLAVAEKITRLEQFSSTEGEIAGEIHTTDKQA
jgi:hypothetical protein